MAVDLVKRNVLADALPPIMGRIDLANWLEVAPSPGPWQKHKVEEEIEKIFVVNSKILDVAESILDVMRLSAEAQDLQNVLNRARAYGIEEEIAEVRQALAFGVTEKGTMRGLCLYGITGTGKTAVLENIRRLIPQVVVHDFGMNSPVLHLKQLTHLTVPVSGDGSPRSFYYGALFYMDRALGTSYLQEGQKHRLSVDALLFFFLSKLILHRVLLLVVEEAQDRNFYFERYKKEFQTFFLTALNLYIPVLLVGNPLGVQALFDSSQVKRRLCGAGLFRFEPIMDWRDETWRLDLVSEVWGACPFAVKDEEWCSKDELAEDLWLATGGFKSHLASLRVATIQEAMKAGSSQVLRVHFEQAKVSAWYAGNIRLSQGFAERDPAILSEFSDIDSNYYASMWGKMRRSHRTSSSQTEGLEGGAAAGAAVDKVPKRGGRTKTAAVPQGADPVSTAGPAPAPSVLSPGWVEGLPKFADS